MDQNLTFLSIIVPLYNKEKEIERLIKSIINSDSFFNIEIIIVDDCSTDNSLLLVEKYLHENIKLIKLNKNKGVSSVRNVGIENAIGKWLLFLDADDYFFKEGLTNVRTKLLSSSSDVVFFSYLTDDNILTGLVKEKKYHYLEYINERTVDGDFLFKDVKDALCCVKSDLLKKYNIKWVYQNLDYIFKNEICIRSKHFDFYDCSPAVYDRSTVNSLTKLRKKDDVKLMISDIKLLHQISFLMKYKEYFRNEDASRINLKKIYYNYKYSKKRYKYLFRILKLIMYLKSKYYLRFIIVTFIPIRTYVKLKLILMKYFKY